jgi:hypothetical protein
MATPILRLENITKYFGRFKALVAVSLEFEDAEALSSGPAAGNQITNLEDIAPI